jgi:ribose/xylose/arabinose/galactoside ABC-type transport system permease subunit
MKLSIRSMTFASVLTALIMALLTLPFHIMRWGMVGRPWGHGMMVSHPGMSGWPIAAWMLLAFAVLIVYAGIAGAVFAAIYNAFAPRQP